MENSLVRDIATRFSENPLLTTDDIKPSSSGVSIAGLFNPAVFRFDKKIWLLARVSELPDQSEGHITIPLDNSGEEVETRTFSIKDPKLDVTDPRIVRYDGDDFVRTLSHFRLMVSDDGKQFYESEEYNPLFGLGELETLGIEDCRVTEINGIYYLTYTEVSSYGVGVGLMLTRDWKRFERKGMIFPPYNKDCAIFEEKIRDRYYALHRPSSPELGGNYIWLAESPDTIHWGNHRCIATTRKNMWDSVRIGAGCSPIETPQGWLAIYYGADTDDRYCLGALLLDIKEPWRVIARSESPLMEPTESYETNGLVGDVIFTNGHLVIGDKLKLYYGARDSVICGAEFSIQEVLNSLSPVKK